MLIKITWRILIAKCTSDLEKSMQTKLTLRIDEKVIEKAKRISRKRGKSISKMVSDFIQNEDRKENESVEVYPPITKKLKD